MFSPNEEELKMITNCSFENEKQGDVMKRDVNVIFLHFSLSTEIRLVLELQTEQSGQGRRSFFGPPGIRETMVR